MPQEKIRVYALARELNMDSKDLLDICRDANIEVRNQLSSLEPEQRDQILEMVRRGGSVATAAPPSAPKPANLPPPEPSHIRTLPPVRPRKKQEEAPEEQPAPVTKEQPPEQEAPAAPPEAEKPETAPAAEETKPEEAAPAAEPVASAPAETEPETAPTSSVEEPEVESKSEEAPEEEPAEPAPAAATKEEEPKAEPPKEPAAPERAEQPRRSDPGSSPGGMGATSGRASKPLRNLDSPSRSGGSGEGSGGKDRPRRPRTGDRRGSNVRLAAPPPSPLKSVKPTSEKSEDKDKKSGKNRPASGTGATKIGELTPEMLKGGGGSIFERFQRRGLRPDAAPVPDEDDDDREGQDKDKPRPGKSVPGRNQRHREREERGKQRRAKIGTALIEGESEEGQRRPRRRREHRRKAKSEATIKPRKDSRIPLEVPITVRSLSESLGVPSGDIIRMMMQEGAFCTINTALEPELAENLAIGLGFEVEIKRPPDLEEQVLMAADQEDDPESLKPRAPIVTVMGHVDHGKTSLLDRIRESDVVASEVGGITQSIRAWRVVHDGKPVTFLDTPGHEAFTQMRARGANVTDIAVIVVAADDGVMPQTEEAISHARAAGVEIVIAINKIDLPNANLPKTEQQLYSMGLIPDNMGGETPFVYTSASTGEGIDLLLENISLVAELKELKANPDKPAQGLCLEASVNEKEGVSATVLVEEGTLRKNDVVLCGSSFGTVRAMFDDHGRPIDQAEPSVPVRILGLNEVPNADDPFYVVQDVATAGKIAEKRRRRDVEESQTPRGPVRLEDLTAGEIAELKIILKADVKGSLEAIKKEMEKFQHAEVRIKILLAGVGGITENDVNLALTAPESTIIVGFNVVPDDRAMALADDRGVQIRQYNIIYNLTDDIRSALEGKLKPREEVIHLGRAVVRQTFKISRTGTIAGCYVTQGLIERSSLVRIIRNGVVVYPPPGREVGLDSLKRHKDDVREVKQGFECGMKVTGYDDIKVDDVIEAYRIERVRRKLDE